MPSGSMVGASVVGAGLNALGASSAASKQARAARDAAAQQMAMFQTIRGDLSPYRDIGASSLPSIAKLLGLGGGTAGATDWDSYLKQNPDAAKWVADKMASQGGTAADWAQQHYTLDQQANGGTGRALPTYGASDGSDIQGALEALPGYQFTRDQGIKSLTNNISARGLGGVSGAFGKGLARYVTGLADTTYGSQLDRLMKVAGVGQSAAAQTGQFGSTAAANAGQATIGAGNAQAAGTIGATSALANGLQSAAGWGSGMYGNMFGNGGGNGGGGFNYTSPSFTGQYVSMG